MKLSKQDIYCLLVGFCSFILGCLGFFRRYTEQNSVLAAIQRVIFGSDVVFDFLNWILDICYISFAVFVILTICCKSKSVSSVFAWLTCVAGGVQVAACVGSIIRMLSFGNLAILIGQLEFEGVLAGSFWLLLESAIISVAFLVVREYAYAKK